MGKEPLATSGEGSKPGRTGNGGKRLTPGEVRTVFPYPGRYLDRWVNTLM